MLAGLLDGLDAPASAASLLNLIVAHIFFVGNPIAEVTSRMSQER